MTSTVPVRHIPPTMKVNRIIFFIGKQLKYIQITFFGILHVKVRHYGDECQIYTRIKKRRINLADSLFSQIQIGLKIQLTKQYMLRLGRQRLIRVELAFSEKQVLTDMSSINCFPFSKITNITDFLRFNHTRSNIFGHKAGGL